MIDDYCAIIEVDCVECGYHFLIPSSEEGDHGCPECGAPPNAVDWTPPEARTLQGL